MHIWMRGKLFFDFSPKNGNYCFVTPIGGLIVKVKRPDVWFLSGQLTSGVYIVKPCKMIPGGDVPVFKVWERTSLQVAPK